MIGGGVGGADPEVPPERRVVEGENMVNSGKNKL